ncbi:hypothetical protein ACLOJK_006516 [Asimina triloba]
MGLRICLEADRIAKGQPGSCPWSRCPDLPEEIEGAAAEVMFDLGLDEAALLDRTIAASPARLGHAPLSGPCLEAVLIGVSSPALDDGQRGLQFGNFNLKVAVTIRWLAAQMIGYAWPPLICSRHAHYHG